MEGAWKLPKQKPVSAYVHVFLGIEIIFGIRSSEESIIWWLRQLSYALDESGLEMWSHDRLWVSANYSYLEFGS